jgi:hypothetical protein
MVLLFIVIQNVYERAETHEILYSTRSGEGILWYLHSNSTVIMILKYCSIIFFRTLFCNFFFVAFTGPAVHCQ